MDNTTHFIGVTGKSLSRLAALIEEAANVLDARGGRRLRLRIVKELHLSLGALRAANNSTTVGFGDYAAGGDFLEREIDRVVALKRGAAQREPAAQRISSSRRSHLRVVAGTDMEARNGASA